MGVSSITLNTLGLCNTTQLNFRPFNTNSKKIRKKQKRLPKILDFICAGYIHLWILSLIFF